LCKCSITFSLSPTGSIIRRNNTNPSIELIKNIKINNILNTFLLDETNNLLYYGYKNNIKVSNLNGNTLNEFLQYITKVKIWGYNFGKFKSNILSLAIRNIDCSTLVYYNSSYVECILGNSISLSL
jgi:hypothetical protein